MAPKLATTLQQWGGPLSGPTASNSQGNPSQSQPYSVGDWNFAHNGNTKKAEDDSLYTTKIQLLESTVEKKFSQLENQLTKLAREFENMKNANHVGAKVSFCDEEKLVAADKGIGPQGNALPKTSTNNHATSILQKSKGLSQKQDKATENSDRLPLHIRSLPPASFSQLSHQPLQVHSMQGFSFQFLTEYLGGEEWAPGFYASSSNLPSLLGKARLGDSGTKKLRDTTNKPAHLDLSSLKAKEKGLGTTYYILDPEIQPFAPIEPGKHGATIFPFLHDFDDAQDRYKDVPVFVAVPVLVSNNNKTTTQSCASPQDKQYIYVGNYTQNRWSDRLDVDRIATLVPETSMAFWCSYIASPNRPEWLTDELKSHLGGPAPTYLGPLPADNNGSNFNDPKIQSSIKSFFADLREHAAEVDARLSSLSETSVRKAFQLPDADDPPGFRFWWEYLEYAGFERNFYYALTSAAKQQTPNAEVRAEAPASSVEAVDASVSDESWAPPPTVSMRYAVW